MEEESVWENTKEDQDRRIMEMERKRSLEAASRRALREKRAQMVGAGYSATKECLSGAKRELAVLFGYIKAMSLCGGGKMRDEEVCRIVYENIKTSVAMGRRREEIEALFRKSVLRAIEDRSSTEEAIRRAFRNTFK